jgi:hypothetical protein
VLCAYGLFGDNQQRAQCANERTKGGAVCHMEASLTMRNDNDPSDSPGINISCAGEAPGT